MLVKKPFFRCAVVRTWSLKYVRTTGSYVASAMMILSACKGDICLGESYFVEEERNSATSVANHCSVYARLLQS